MRVASFAIRHTQRTPDIIDAFKAQGDGWQTRMNDALRGEIREDRHREGFGREAAGLLAQWASDALCVECFTYPVAEENYRSRRIAESLGGVVVARRGTPKYRSVVYRLPRQSTSRVSNVALRPATELDWEFVSAVQAQCMREYAERTWASGYPSRGTIFDRTFTKSFNVTGPRSVVLLARRT